MNYVAVPGITFAGYVKGRANEGEIYLYGRFGDFFTWWEGWFNGEVMCNEGRMRFMGEEARRS